MNKNKIVITQDIGLYPDQKNRLGKLGEIIYYDKLANSYDEWVNRCQKADIIVSGKFGLKQKYQKLKNKFFSLRFVGINFFDKEVLKKNNLTVSYSPGCNKDAVSEWAVFMVLNLLREFNKYVNVNNLPKDKIPDATKSLTNKQITILGKGNIGLRVGKICKAMDMNVRYFTRKYKLNSCVKDTDVIVNALNTNPSTKNILNKDFFFSLKPGSYFITFTGREIFDLDAMIQALDKGILAGAAIDAGSIQVGDVYDEYYQKILKHPRILVTPHIAYNTDVTDKIGNDMVIENIEAWINGKPINLLK